jgi:hypothetical protein
VGEWCRETLLARVSGEEPRAATDCAGTGQVALMAELPELRAILLNVLFKLANGQMLEGEEMQERNRLCLLKNSCFVKIAGLSETENVYQNGDGRL